MRPQVPLGHFPPQPCHRWKEVWFPEKQKFPKKIVGVTGPSVPKCPPPPTPRQGKATGGLEPQ